MITNQLIKEYEKKIMKLLVIQEKYDKHKPYYDKLLREKFLISKGEIHNTIIHLRAKIEQYKEDIAKKEEMREDFEYKLNLKNKMRMEFLQQKTKAKIQAGSEIEKVKADVQAQSKLQLAKSMGTSSGIAPEKYEFAIPMENGIFNPKIRGEEYVELSTNKTAGELLTPDLMTNSGVGTPITHWFKSNIYKNTYYVIKENSNEWINKCNGENVVLLKVNAKMPIGHSWKVNSIWADIGGPQYGI